MTTKILIVDDHPMIRSAVAALLGGSDFAIAATADSAEAAFAAIGDSDPDMVILDLAMPGASGLDVLRRLRERGDRRPVIILTAGIDDYPLTEALSLGVDGIVMKNNDPAFLLDCLKSVQDGERLLDPDVQARAFEPFFTTKDVGKGTGLGLDISRRIIAERHHGQIIITSEPGNTVVSVRVPRASTT